MCQDLKVIQFKFLSEYNLKVFVLNARLLKRETPKANEADCAI